MILAEKKIPTKQVLMYFTAPFRFLPNSFYLFFKEMKDWNDVLCQFKSYWFESDSLRIRALK